MADWTNLTYVVVDMEGNGQQPPDLVELAAVPIVGGVIGEPMSWLVQPPRPIEYYATRIHGLTNQDVDDAPIFAAIANQVRRALDADALVAHNAHVDVGVLQRHLGDWECPEVFDTLKLIRRLVPNQISYKLGALTEAFKLAEGCRMVSTLTARRMTRWSLLGCLSYSLARSPRSKNYAARHQEGARMKLQPFSDHQRGVFVSVDGPSGAGKSTIVRHLAQLLVGHAALRRH
jgi:hypothetical protein